MSNDPDKADSLRSGADPLGGKFAVGGAHAPPPPPLPMRPLGSVAGDGQPAWRCPGPLVPLPLN